MNPFVETIRNIGGMRLVAMGGVTIGLIMFFIFITTRLATPSMTLLCTSYAPRKSPCRRGRW